MIYILLLIIIGLLGGWVVVGWIVGIWALFMFLGWLLD